MDLHADVITNALEICALFCAVRKNGFVVIMKCGRARAM